MKNRRTKLTGAVMATALIIIIGAALLGSDVNADIACKSSSVCGPPDATVQCVTTTVCSTVAPRDSGTDVVADVVADTKPDVKPDAVADVSPPPADVGPPPGKFLYHGLSLAGADFNASIGATFNGNIYGTIPNYYYYPDDLANPIANVFNYPTPPGYTAKAYPYYHGRGMNFVRLPFRWERLQRAVFAPLYTADLTILEKTVTDLKAAGFTVMLDMHNYTSYASAAEIASGALGDKIGSAAVPIAAFADFWSKMAAIYANDPQVVFDLMNEPLLPNPYGNADYIKWPNDAQAAINAIRAAGANNLIMVEGNQFSDPSIWNAPFVSDGLAALTDPASNFVFEPHCYPDDSGGGGSNNCSDPNAGVTRMAPFITWARAHHAKGFLGEFSSGIDNSANANCITATDNELKSIEAASDVFIGWTYWAGGSGWGSNNPMESGVITGVDSAAMQLLVKHINAF